MSTFPLRLPSVSSFQLRQDLVCRRDSNDGGSSPFLTLPRVGGRRGILVAKSVNTSDDPELAQDGKEAGETLRENRHHLFGSQQGKATDTTISPANSTRRRPQIQMS